MKLALIRSGRSKDSLPINPLKLLVLRLKTSTMMTMISITPEECLMEPRWAATKLKNRERKMALKLNLKLQDPIVAS